VNCCVEKTSIIKNFKAILENIISYTHTYSHYHTHTHTHIHSNTHTHTHTHTSTLSLTHNYTRAHIHTSQPFLPFLASEICLYLRYFLQRYTVLWLRGHLIIRETQRGLKKVSLEGFTFLNTNINAFGNKSHV